LRVFLLIAWELMALFAFSRMARGLPATWRRPQAFTHRRSIVSSALASVGVFAETKRGRFKLTPLAATLQTGVPGSQRGWALMINEKYTWTPGRSSFTE
jgi:hypothetical protein